MQAYLYIKENEFKNIAINIVIKYWEEEKIKRRVKRRNSENIVINIINNI